uniref:F-box domain-containing protein n=1 Tax=Brassica oleracea var. oleracea TaxID=109376 RepID=A0A0D3DCV0_BRAOL
SKGEKNSHLSLSLWFFFLFWPRTRKRVEAVRRAADGSAFEKCIFLYLERILKSYDGNMVDASRICFIVWKNMSEETLVKLTLGSHIDLGNIPSGVSLPALKSLFINTIFFTYGDLCNVLLPGCPVLEELSICPACHLILTPASADVSPIEEDAGLRDLIIWLPEEVLGSILSLLPTKQAASTSVLAKKWRHV